MLVSVVGICIDALLARFNHAAGVGDSIVEFAKAKGVDMVVIGSRGLGSIQRWACSSSSSSNSSLYIE